METILRYHIQRKTSNFGILSLWYDANFHEIKDGVGTNRTAISGDQITLQKSQDDPSKIIFRFDFDVESELYIGQFAKKGLMVSYKPKKFGKLPRNQDRTDSKIFNNLKQDSETFMQGLSQVYQDAHRFANRLKKSKKKIVYDEGITTQRLVNSRIAEAIVNNEEENLDEIKEEEKKEKNVFSTSQLVKNKKNKKMSKAELKAYENPHIQGEVETKASEDFPKISRLLRNTSTIYILLFLHLIFFLTIVGLDSYFLFISRREISLREGYSKLQSYLYFTSFDLSTVASSILGLIAMHHHHSTTYLPKEKFFDRMHTTLQQVMERLESSEDGITSALEQVDNARIKYAYFTERDITMEYLTGSPKLVTMQEAIKQILTNLIQLASSNLDEVSDKQEEAFFIFRNSNLKLQEKLFYIKTAENWRQVLDEEINSRKAIFIRFIYLSAATIFFMVVFFLLMKVEVRNVGRVLDIIFAFTRNDCHEMNEICELYNSKILFCLDKGLSDDGREEFEEFEEAVIKDDEFKIINTNNRDDDDEIVLVKQRKKTENICRVFACFFAPGIIIPLLTVGISFLSSVIETDYIVRLDYIQELKTSTLTSIEQTKIIKEAIDQTVNEFDGPAWNGSISSLEMANIIYNETISESNLFLKDFVISFDTQSDLKQYFNEIFTNNICSTLRRTLNKTVIIEEERGCEDLYGSILTKVS